MRPSVASLLHAARQPQHRGSFLLKSQRGHIARRASRQSLEGGTPRSKGDFRRKLDDYAAQRGLSAREAETLRYLVAGRGDSQIAEAMGISYNTARTHVRNVFTKLDVHDRQTLIDVVNNELG